MHTDNADTTDARRFFFGDKSLEQRTQNESSNNKFSSKGISAIKKMLLEGHPELVSGSHRDPISMPYRGQMLKFAIEREQSQTSLNCAEREQIEQS